MALFQTELLQRKQKLEKWTKQLADLDGPISREQLRHDCCQSFESLPGISTLGTIGGGNHFAELQEVIAIEDPAACRAAGLEEDRLLLLVHSGSRGLGEALFREMRNLPHFDGLPASSPQATTYLEGHAQAVRWAQTNRGLIAQRFAACLRSEVHTLLDNPHNLVEPAIFAEKQVWLHRKGAACADRGILVIPGSRGSHSYLVQPCTDGKENLFSLAHGAGRKWPRSECKARLRERFSAEALRRTALGSHVVCEDKDLLYEESPQAYKKIEAVIDVLVQAGLVRVLAQLKPLITYKVREGAHA